MSRIHYRPNNNDPTQPSWTAQPKFISNSLKISVIWNTSEDVLILQQNADLFFAGLSAPPESVSWGRSRRPHAWSSKQSFQRRGDAVSNREQSQRPCPEHIPASLSFPWRVAPLNAQDLHTAELPVGMQAQKHRQYLWLLPVLLQRIHRQLIVKLMFSF